MLSRGEDMALLMGRLFVAALFLPSGFHKLMTFSAYAASLKAKGLPFAVLWAGVLVAAEVLGPLALIIGAWPRWTALALVAFTAVTLWLSHRTSFAGARVSAAAECGPLSHAGDHGGPAVLLREWAGGLELERQQCWSSGKGLITPSIT